MGTIMGRFGVRRALKGIWAGVVGGIVGRGGGLVVLGLLCCCMGQAVWAQEGAEDAEDVIPAFYREPGFYPNRDYVNQAQSEYIDPFTGSLQLHYVDLYVPGNGGFDLKVIRSYNSASVDWDAVSSETLTSSNAGYGWKVHFGRILQANQGKDTACLSGQVASRFNPVLELPDGSRQTLVGNDQDTDLAGGRRSYLLSVQRWKAQCIGINLNGKEGFKVYSPDGVVYEMTHLVEFRGSGLRPGRAWYATRITDRNGNEAVIEYAAEGSPEITRVATSDGRRIVFDYDKVESGAVTLSMIRSISTDAGQSVRYDYHSFSTDASQGNSVPKGGLLQLKSVTRADGYAWGYEYYGLSARGPQAYLVKSVRYPIKPATKYTTCFSNISS